MTAHQRCFSCNSAEFEAHLEKRKFRYIRCRRCGHSRLDPLPNVSATAPIYGEQYFLEGVDGGYANYAADEALHRRNAEARLNLLDSSLNPAGRRLLDVGCAIGFFLDEAQRRGYESKGVEISGWARAEAQRRTGLEPFPDLPSAISAHPDGFDVITFFQVLEHMPRPDEAIAQAIAALRPGGQLIIETWDASSFVARILRSTWQQITPPSVVHLFTRSSLKYLLERNGMTKVTIQPFSKWVSLGLIASQLAAKHPALSPSVRLLSTLHLERRGFHYSLGDLIVVNAKDSAR